jgi:hypothetical protein
MRKTAIALLFVALLLGVLRVGTGIVYRSDAPVAFLVVKHAPALAIERTESAAEPVARDIVLDREEPDLFYGGLYRAIMQVAPIAILVLIAGAVLLFARGRRLR